MKDKKTKVFNEKFNGYDMFAVWQVNDNGDKVGNYPLFSVSKKKAASILPHWEDFMRFAEDGKTEIMANLGRSK